MPKAAREAVVCWDEREVCTPQRGSVLNKELRAIFTETPRLIVGFFLQRGSGSSIGPLSDCALAAHGAEVCDAGGHGMPVRDMDTPCRQGRCRTGKEERHEVSGSFS